MLRYVMLWFRPTRPEVYCTLRV